MTIIAGFSIGTYYTLQNTQHSTSHIETYGEHVFNLSDGPMGYYYSDIDLSDCLESNSYSTIRALEKSAFSWTADEITISEITCESDEHTDVSTRKKKYTKTRALTPYKPQAIFFP